MYRNSYVKVELDKLKDNARFFMNKTHKKIIAVVKADGYGLIDYMEAKTLSEIGVDFFAVSSLDEAMSLRNHDIKGEILVLGYVPVDNLDIVRDNNISIVSLSKEYIEKADLNNIKVHLKINTGMNRVGIEPEDAGKVLESLLSKGAKVEGIMSHFSSADEDIEYSKKQYQLFKDTINNLEYNFKYIHMCATDASQVIDDDISTHCRIGLGLLGYCSYSCDIKPCVTLVSEVISIKQIEKGKTVSYNRRYTSDGKGYVVTIPLGYADGFKKINVNHEAYVDGEYGTIIGNICMDMLMIHTDSYHEVGSTVELLGGHIDVNKRAQEVNIINYELLISLNNRLTRKYYDNGKLRYQVDRRFNNIKEFQ
ncbi:MAG: alanine racemase [Erysipelotrichaceae bacterium]|nr:alanine racemase [Erysipelotrichaceae bacterium]